MHRLSYKIMLIISLLLAIGGVITLLPNVNASYPNIIGYKSVCTFTPAGTFFCFALAGISCFIRSTFIKDQSGSAKERLKKHSKSLIPVLILLIIALGFTYKYTLIKAPYIDGTTSASYEE